MSGALRQFTARQRDTGFDPSELSPKAWWDASDATSITASGGEVTQWADLSGNGWTLQPTSSTERPGTGVTTQNGLNVLDFDGVDELRTGSNFGLVGTGALTVFVAFSVATVARYTALFNQGESQADSCIACGYGWNPNGDPNMSMLTDQWKPAHSYGDTIISLSTPYVAAWRIDPVNSHHTATDIWLNNAPEVMGTFIAGGTLSLVNAPAQVGGWGAGQHDGWIGEVIVCDANLSNTQVDDCNTYLMNKWGI